MRSDRIGHEEDDTDMGTAKAAARPAHIPVAPRAYVPPKSTAEEALMAQEAILDQLERKAGHSAEWWNLRNSFGRPGSNGKA